MDEAGRKESGKRGESMCSQPGSKMGVLERRALLKPKLT